MSVKGGLYMLKVFKNEKLWCAVAGAAAVIVGKKILKADKTRSLAVTGLAKGMKLQKDAKAAFQNMKDEASDICYDAKTEAGIHEDAAAARTLRYCPERRASSCRIPPCRSGCRGCPGRSWASRWERSCR